MRRWTAAVWVGGLLGLAVALGGCGKTATQAEPTPPSDAVTPATTPTPPTPGAEATPAEGATPAAGETQPGAENGEAAKGDDETGAEAAPTAEGGQAEANGEGAEATPAEGAEPAAPKLEGKLLNVKDDVRILCPDGWKERDADDGSLLRLVRTKPVGNVEVNFSLDYTVDKSLPANLTVDAFRQEFVNRLPQLFADRQFALVKSEATTVAGRGAVSAVGDLTTDAGTFRAKMVVVLQGGAVWTLSVIGPKTEFADLVEPEFDAIVQSFELP